MNYIFHLLIIVGIYIILALSLNLLIGYGGLLSIAHAAFYGIGAYIYTLSLIKINVPFWGALIISIMGTSLIAFAFGYSTLRIKGDYFILATIGFQMIVFEVLYNWINLTNGPDGITRIPRASIFNVEFKSIPTNLILVLFFVFITLLFYSGIHKSPFSRILMSIKENEIITQSLGKNTYKVKIWAFVLAGGTTALAGFLYANYNSYINPKTFSLDQSIFILAIVLVGGSGNLLGPILGVVLLVLVPESLRFAGLPDTVEPNIRQILYSLIIIIIMFLRPQGFAGKYELE